MSDPWRQIESASWWPEARAGGWTLGVTVRGTCLHFDRGNVAEGHPPYPVNRIAEHLASLGIAHDLAEVTLAIDDETQVRPP